MGVFVQLRIVTFFVFAALFSGAFLQAAARAADGQVVECGAPETGDIATDPGVDFCDIYSRQIEYAEERKKLSEQLRERQANFIAPRIEARKAYEERMDEIHGFAKKKSGDYDVQQPEDEAEPLNQ